ncbi:peptidoglycan glycosyltransferase [Anaerosolibacter carboniphilus]|uniref:Peptidoglycan glycosyltransferase n=1 Tax=Anaerosolibacter carboniphilus TaxID=1417629 RepID=A0A841KZD1_9FIRM|nr:penicillin-binding transpeptidase domain-containing protein [Anaerosolibacter carboniphilus]MBB6216272.1 peptidoglycan glycosyltransferase [Anaerosolibacter carboniphilus]
MNQESKRIVKVLWVMGALFIALVVYLSYFEIFRATKIVTNNYNKRQWLNEEYVLRGQIVDRNGKTLAYSEKTDDNKQVRKYKYGSLYSHLIGYSDKEYGKSGLESSYNNELLNINASNPILEITEKITGPKEKGNNLILTIDHDLQNYASQLLGNKKGALIAMNPKSGEVYAMVSKPDFNTTTFKENWEELVEDDQSPLLNRATSGLYTPGSVFKIITAAGALQNHEINTEYQCEGSVNIEGYVLREYQEIAHGNVDLEKAMAESCNVAFSQIGLQLGEQKLQDTAEKFMFNRIIPFDLKTKSSIFPSKGIMTKPELGASAIGQGKVLITPLNMVLATSAIANDGVMMRPILVKEILSSEGKTLKVNYPQALTRASSSLIAREIRDMMIKVVDDGTGKNAKIKNIKVAGKTGTAENDTGKAHAWFAGFAPADDPKVVVVVVLESYGSTGGKSAAPLARDMMIRTINRVK